MCGYTFKASICKSQWNQYQLITVQRRTLTDHSECMIHYAIIHSSARYTGVKSPGILTVGKINIIPWCPWNNISKTQLPCKKTFLQQKRNLSQTADFIHFCWPIQCYSKRAPNWIISSNSDNFFCPEVRA